jgi:outer membrane protein assembly factor BamD
MRIQAMMRAATAAVLIAASLRALVVAAAPPSGQEEAELDERFVLFSRPKKDTPAAQLAWADELWQAGKRKAALKAYHALVKRWPTADEAPAALYRKGILLQERGKRRDAFETFQELIDRHTGHFPYDDVLQRQFDLAVEFMDQRVGAVLFLPGFESPERALEMLEKIVENGRRGRRAAEAQFLIGHIHETVHDYDLAVVAYLNTSLLYPSSDFAEKAAFARARCLVALSDKSPYDQKLTQEAWYALTVFNTTYPHSEFAQDAQDLGQKVYDRRAQAAFDIAEYYEKNTERTGAAVAQYQAFLDSFPNSQLADKARRRLERLTAERENQRER